VRGRNALYNLFVTFREGAFDSLAYELERGRFCEYTSPELKGKFDALTPVVIKKLKSIPSLFVYEGGRGEARVGHLQRICERGGHILVEFNFDHEIPPFPGSKLADLSVRLDIRSWEMNRTHWAIKEENLLSVLTSAGIISGDQPSPAHAQHIEEIRFKVALSFPGEHRDYVARVAEVLKGHLPSSTVFYDRDFTAQLARPNLDTLLQTVYGENSDLVVIFLSEHYEQKDWCGLEWRAIRGYLKKKQDHALMFMRFDQATVPGTSSLDGYVDLNHHTPEEAAVLILERVQLNDRAK
jgi:TIR domain